MRQNVVRWVENGADMEAAITAAEKDAQYYVDRNLFVI